MDDLFQNLVTTGPGPNTHRRQDGDGQMPQGATFGATFDALLATDTDEWPAIQEAASLTTPTFASGEATGDGPENARSWITPLTSPTDEVDLDAGPLVVARQTDEAAHGDAEAPSPTPVSVTNVAINAQIASAAADDPDNPRRLLAGTNLPTSPTATSDPDAPILLPPDGHSVDPEKAVLGAQVPAPVVGGSPKMAPEMPNTIPPADRAEQQNRPLTSPVADRRGQQIQPLTSPVADDAEPPVHPLTSPTANRAGPQTQPLTSPVADRAERQTLPPTSPVADRQRLQPQPQTIPPAEQRGSVTSESTPPLGRSGGAEAQRSSQPVGGATQAAAPSGSGLAKQLDPPPPALSQNQTPPPLSNAPQPSTATITATSPMPSELEPDSSPRRDVSPRRIGGWTFSPAGTSTQTAAPALPAVLQQPTVPFAALSDQGVAPDALPDLDFALLTPTTATATQLLAPAAGVLGQVPSATAQGIAQQIAVAMSSTSNATDTPLELALDPPELGHVRMQISEVSGVMTLMIQAERPETADLMRRHLELLAQEFAEAGLDAPSVHISDGRAERDGTSPPEVPPSLGPDAGAVPDSAEPILPSPPAASGGLDLRL